MLRLAFQTAVAIAVAAIPAPALAGESLNMFAALLGKCFTASVGEGARDRHCFTPLFGGKHLRDSHRVLIGGKIVYRGETTYSLDSGTVSFLYINSLGGSGHGEARQISGGIAFTGTMHAEPGAQPQSRVSTWALLAGGGYEASDGKGKPVHYRPDLR